MSDLPVVNECFYPYSQCAKKCARCPKVENSVASEPSKSTSQCIAVCTKRHLFGGPQSRDLSAQPGAAEISVRSQEQPGVPQKGHRSLQEGPTGRAALYLKSHLRSHIPLSSPCFFAYSEKLSRQSYKLLGICTLNLARCLQTNWKSCLIP